MNLRSLRVLDAVSGSALNKLVADFIKTNRSDVKATYPFSADGMTGDVDKKGSACTFTFYKADNKVLSPPSIVSITLPKGGTDAEVTKSLASDLEAFLNKKEGPSALDVLKTQLGELKSDLIPAGNTAVKVGQAGINAVNNLKVEKF